MAAENSSQSMRIDIAGREFQIDCTDDNRETLLEAASLANEEIMRNRTRADSAELVPLDVAAVLTALNFAGELVERSRSDGSTSEQDGAMIDRLIDELDQAMRD